MSGCYGSAHPDGKGPVQLYTPTLAEREAAASCFEEVSHAQR